MRKIHKIFGIFFLLQLFGCSLSMPDFGNSNTAEINNQDYNKVLNLVINEFEILGTCKELPMPVFSDQEYAEEIRLKYRFLDLRRKKIHENIILRSKVISYIRNEMTKF